MGGFFVPMGTGKVALPVSMGTEKVALSSGRYAIYETIQDNKWKSKTGRLLAAYHSLASVYHNRIYKWTEGYHCFKSR